MWHETDSEMNELMGSILRLDMDQCAMRFFKQDYKICVRDYYELESKTFWNQKIEWALNCKQRTRSKKQLLTVIRYWSTAFDFSSHILRRRLLLYARVSGQMQAQRGRNARKLIRNDFHWNCWKKRSKTAHAGHTTCQVSDTIWRQTNVDSSWENQNVCPLEGQEQNST